MTIAISQSSLLFLPKPSLSPPRPLATLTLIRSFSSSPSPRSFSRPRLAASAGEDIKPEIDIGGGGDVGGGGGGEGFGRGGGGGGEGEEEQKKKKSGMSMSQKLTLGYAALVGVGGIMGYMKSGSQKSLAAGGISSLLLYYVYTQLPSKPAFASSLGLGVSAALLAVMGSRFKKSGKVFPAGVVSLVSFVMVGGYFHGIMRSSHA
ncbi:uncharacterized protein M6B38_375945 [Iris pallida]|uniref:Uncharacterized protein n=1 Tax=Iris pallida TaxID=29817 RepID=A0AAX6GAY6_IRIPA|nr:uncharacterized protein M6B38_375945 [Iris pallida]